MLLYSAVLCGSLIHILTTAAAEEVKNCTCTSVVLTRTLVAEPQFPAGIVLKKEVTYSYWPDFEELPQGLLSNKGRPEEASYRNLIHSERSS